MYPKKPRLSKNALGADKGDMMERINVRSLTSFTFFTLMPYASAKDRALQLLGIIACTVAGAVLVYSQLLGRQHDRYAGNQIS